MENNIAQAMAIANRYTEVRIKAKIASEAISSASFACGVHSITGEQDKILKDAIRVLADIQEKAGEHNARIYVEQNLIK